MSWCVQIGGACSGAQARSGTAVRRWCTSTDRQPVRRAVGSAVSTLACVWGSTLALSSGSGGRKGLATPSIRATYAEQPDEFAQAVPDFATALLGSGRTVASTH
jgi:hypothetical protein